MDPERLRKHAELLVRYCLSVRPGQRILLSTSCEAIPLLRELQRAVLAEGARPLIDLSYPGQMEEFIRAAPEGLLDEVFPLGLQAIEMADASLHLIAPYPPVATDPQRAARLQKAQAPLARVRSSKTWSLSLFPTAYAAELANLPLPEYEAFVESAMFLDDPDPVARWAAVRARQAELIGVLSAGHTLKIRAAQTDLTMSVQGRTWVNSDGKRNMPSGEVFTGPVEPSVEGTIRFDVGALYQAQPVEGVTLRFAGGQVVEARAEVGDDILQAALQADAGARWVGEIGIGTNYGIQRATKSILFDEKIGGTVHLALGRSYPETGGVNQSAIHWDLICDLRGGGELLLDDRVIQRSGQFLI
jgi:aminopeptidase